MARPSREAGAATAAQAIASSDAAILLEMAVELGSNPDREQALESALLATMARLQADRGCLLLRDEGDRYRVRMSHGLPDAAPATVSVEGLETGPLSRDSSRSREALQLLGLDLLWPVGRGASLKGAIGIAPRPDLSGGRTEAAAFLRLAAACVGPALENLATAEELRRLDRRLSVKIFQLENLFDISRELTANLDEEAVKNLLVSAAMGHLMVSRCALYLAVGGGLTLAHARGLRGGEGSAVVPAEDAGPVLDALDRPRPVADLPPGKLREHLQRSRLVLAVPLGRSGLARGLLALGERVSGGPFSQEDREFVHTLAGQAQAALEAAHLHRVRVEKERQDREMQIAREIQESLFPQSWPEIPGFEVAARSLPCRQVGGDYYDLIPLEGGRLAVVIADVSGKGTPASILMASVHASLRALAGGAEPTELMRRLNQFLFHSTQPNRFVTLFYAELDPATGRLTYVNAGHVPPHRLSRAGDLERLTAGGPVLGLLDSVCYERGETRMAPGDLLAMVTDGVTEALSPQDREFGEDELLAVLGRCRDRTAADALHDVLAAVDEWSGAAGCVDDLTALVLRALPR